MASSATIPGGGASCDLMNHRRLGYAAAGSLPIRHRSSIAFRRGGPCGAAAISASSTPVSRSDRRRDGAGGGSEAVAYEKLDEWMRDSVPDIVRNLRGAPLMVHMYGGSSVVEKAVDWAEAKGRWEAGGSPVPEGLIFVEELSERHGGVEKRDYDGDGNGDGDSKESVSDGMTKAFGVVVQGRGAECPPVCYLLKTSMAGFGSRSGSGVECGLGCTHFCLVRVNGFRETTESQLKNCWLL